MDRKFFKPHDLKNDPQRFFAVLEEVQLPGLLGTISKLLSHFILFGGTILHLSSAQQLDEMLSLLDSSEALGCLALTELGTVYNYFIATSQY
jgi:alkylation response protein AidB-like acyl-CoA dehydrogenase